MKIIKKITTEELCSLSIGKYLNKKILFLLPPRAKWYEVFLTLKEINKLKRINDQSWEKEFGRIRILKNIRKKILTDKNGGVHANLIKRKLKEQAGSDKKKRLIVLSVSNRTINNYIVLDGHHRIIADLIKKKSLTQTKIILVVVKKNQIPKELRRMI